MGDVFGDILPVRKVGSKGHWFAPWDELIRWWGVEDAMRDLVDRPGDGARRPSRGWWMPTCASSTSGRRSTS